MGKDSSKTSVPNCTVKIPWFMFFLQVIKKRKSSTNVDDLSTSHFLSTLLALLLKRMKLDLVVIVIFVVALGFIVYIFIPLSHIIIK